MITDAHFHIFRKDHPRNETYISEAKKAGISKVCAFLSGLDSTGAIKDNPNCEVLQYRDKYPGFIIPFARISHEDGESALSELERCVNELGMRGLKQSYNVDASDPALLPLIRKAAELKIPILFHTFCGQYCRPERRARCHNETDVTQLAELALKVPDAIIIMAHYNLGDWEYGIKTVKYIKNVYPCTSGSGMDSGQIEMAVKEVGIERIIFGTDSSLWNGLGKIRGAKISDSEKELILGKNLERLFKLRGPLT